ncbi:MAG: transcription elongation factor GreA [Candidatus Omnitrophica bacterium]|nr:transcription elongation factor GreA [Candidatus Omnitrophota bacterium]
MERVYLTQEGHDKMMQELEYLKKVKRREISSAIGQARLLGDLKENAEYHAAKEAASHNEARIHELEDKLSRAEIVHENAVPDDRVCFGVTVKLKDLESEEEIEYNLVGNEEADPIAGKISVSSPVGKALLGHKVNEIVTIEVPAGTLQYKITAISR